jgi:Dienelactone hydrolase family
MDVKSTLTFTPLPPSASPAGRAKSAWERHRGIPFAMLLVFASLAGATVARAQTLPADEASAKVALDSSSRHGEYVDIKATGRPTTIPAFVVYPERPDKAPVVFIIHEAFGLSDWIRAVADQLAASGYIAIALDLKQNIAAGLAAARAYGLKLPACNGKSAAIYYGPSSDAASLTTDETPVVALTGGSIKRILENWPATLDALTKQTK